MKYIQTILLLLFFTLPTFARDFAKNFNIQTGEKMCEKVFNNENEKKACKKYVNNEVNDIEHKNRYALAISVCSGFIKNDKKKAYYCYTRVSKKLFVGNQLKKSVKKCKKEADNVHCAWTVFSTKSEEHERSQAEFDKKTGGNP